ncbi:MAG TPA: hypothetical protein VFZ09_35055 [Archangium sp.]|uniref:hypothetical protein n=1 Tax=Archangium sp. TaxID=1872627 RepID=UPI002E2FF336|nr:hypothetical protein [Archangium sp.]HEX5751495.1 hypothetical protein [Archangium sp.]
MTRLFRSWWRFRGALLCSLLLGVGGLSGCGTGRNSVTGRITPEHFEFTTIVEEEPGEPSGWRAVCIHARITQGDSGATTACKFEVGLPLCNRQQGRISLEDAQEAAAEMANRAVYRVLSEAHPGTMLATLCRDFKELYGVLLEEEFKGAKVGECKTRGVKVVHFDAPYHCD